MTPYRRCRQCNAVNDTRVAGWSRKGEGLVQDAGNDEGDFTVVGGCWFCGSRYWTPTKPVTLPDDRFAHNPKSTK